MLALPLWWYYVDSIWMDTFYFLLLIRHILETEGSSSTFSTNTSILDVSSWFRIKWDAWIFQTGASYVEAHDLWYVEQSSVDWNHLDRLPIGDSGIASYSSNEKPNIRGIYRIWIPWIPDWSSLDRSWCIQWSYHLHHHIRLNLIPSLRIQRWRRMNRILGGLVE